VRLFTSHNLLSQSPWLGWQTLILRVNDPSGEMLLPCPNGNSANEDWPRTQGTEKKKASIVQRIWFIMTANIVFQKT
jgi:hypothetical protein